MPCYGNLNPLSTQTEMPYTPYSSTPYYQTQPSKTPMTPSTALPTGVPSGPPYGGNPSALTPTVTPPGGQAPQTLQSPYYLAGYLRNYIGRDVRVEFLVGSNGPLVDRIGTLLEVGVSYIVIRLIRTDDLEICDLYSIKFVTIYR